MENRNILHAFQQMISASLASLQSMDEEWMELRDLIDRITSYHQWFTPDDVKRRLKEVLAVLEAAEDRHWECPIEELKATSGKRIGVLLRGAIPLEGLEDLLAIVHSGNVFVGKSLEKTDKVLVYLIKRLCREQPQWVGWVEFAGDAPLRQLDGLLIYQPRVPNPALHLYTQRLPHLVRPYRKSLAVLLPQVGADGLLRLGELVLHYLGRSPLSVAKLFVPEGFDLKRIYEAIEPLNGVMQHFKYANNFQYHQFVYLMNKLPFLDNGFLLLKEDREPLSPTGVLFYEYYSDIAQISTQGYERVYRIGE